MNRALFVDRDGTLVEEENYLDDPARARLTPGAAAGLRAVRAAGFLVLVVSNQAGVARGFYGEDTVRAIDRRLEEMLEAEGARVDRYYFCPHHPEFTGPCRCRKPEPGMLVDAARDFDLDLAACWVVGDRLTDVEAGSRAGVPGILVRTGYGREQERVAGVPGTATPEATTPLAVLDDLAAACAWILRPERRRGAAPPAPA